MGRPVSFDFTTGGGSPEEFLMGTVHLEPTLMHTIGNTVVLPDAPYPVKLVNGKAVHPNVAVSPAGPEPAWAYKVTIENELTGKAWSELRGVPTGTTQIAYKELPKFVTTIPPQTTAGMMQNWADTTEANAERSELAADRAEAPTDLMNKNLIEDTASLTNAALTTAIGEQAVAQGNNISDGTDPAVPYLEIFAKGATAAVHLTNQPGFTGPYIIGIGKDAPGSGMVLPNKANGSMIVGDQRSTVTDASPWMKVTNQSTTGSSFRLEQNVAGCAPVLDVFSGVVGPGQIMAKFNNNVGNFGIIFADTGQLLWKRPIVAEDADGSIKARFTAQQNQGVVNKSPVHLDNAGVEFRTYAGSGTNYWPKRITHAGQFVKIQGAGTTVGIDTAPTWIDGVSFEFLSNIPKVGFLGATPVAKQTLPAAATDPASTMALANALRTALINLGLAQ